MNDGYSDDPDIIRALMRSLRFLPITFLAGQHGFLFFAPYLALFLAAMHLIRQRRMRLAALVTIARSAS